MPSSSVEPVDKYLAQTVTSDIKRLQQVIVHRPDRGIEMVTPSNAESLLYDDIVFLPQMKQQHSIFSSLLAAFMGAENVIEFQDLLKDLVKEEQLRHRLLQSIGAFEGLNAEAVAKLAQLKAKNLAQVLITGRIKGEEETIFPPLPNCIFTRDIAVVIKDYIFTCFASKRPRKRETILAWFVVHHHPFFKTFQDKNHFIDLAADEDQLLSNLLNPDVGIEGGDVMVIDEKNVFIGSSQRTNLASIEKVARMMIDQGATEQVTVVDIPKWDTCIHLDTLFTQIAENDFVIYRPVLLDPEKVKVFQYRRGSTKAIPGSSFLEILKEIKPKARLILGGGGIPPYEEREQYASGCNFVALKNGVAISYRRNIATLKELKIHGYNVVKAERLLKKLRDHKITADEIEQTIITIPSSELSRAGGGPHCLTLPVHRAL